MEHTGFPSDETLAAFLDGKLDPDTRRRVMEHMTTCDECYATVIGGGGDLSAASDNPLSATTAFNRRWHWIGGAAAAASAAAAVFLLVVMPRVHPNTPKTPDGEIATLVQATGPYRPTAARLSDFPYRPIEEPKRGIPHDDNVLLEVAFAKAKLAVSERRSPQNLHTYGVACVLNRKWDDAVLVLKEASAADPTKDRVLVDLSAALLARASDGRHPLDSAAALQYAQAVLKLSPKMPAALFNNALAMEAVHPGAAADSAWNEYLAADSTSKWADEARTHLISRKPSNSSSVKPCSPDKPPTELTAVPSGPFRSRRCVEFVLLPAWASLASRGDMQSSASMLRLARDVGARLAAASADHSVECALKDIDHASRKGRISTLSDAYEALARGRDSQLNSKYADADASFGMAARLFQGVSRTGWCWAQISRAAALYETGEHDASYRLTSSAAQCQTPLMAAERNWIRGMALLASGQPMESLQAYSESLAQFEMVGDEEYAGGVHSLLAENLGALGDDERAWREREASIAAFAHFYDPQRQEVALNEAAEAALSQHLPAVALLFQDEVVKIARKGEDHLLLAYALMWRGLIRTRLNMTTGARRDLDEALTEVEMIGDRDARSRTRADLEMAAGAADTSQTRAAIDHYTSALDYYDTHEYRFRSAQLRLARGRALLRNSRPLAALADFYAGIDEVERSAGHINEDMTRSLFFGRTTELFSETLQLLLCRADYDAALQVAERGRERALALNADQHALDAHRDTVGVLQHNLDGATAVIVFAVTPYETVAWAISAESITAATIPLGRVRLAELINQFRQSIERGSPERDKLGAKLYDSLFVRLYNIKRHQRLIIIPDGPLNDVPYAALREPSGLYLIEAVESLTTAPSIHALLGCQSLMARHVPSATPRTLVFGASHFQSADFPDLPGVQIELFAVAKNHRKTELLFGDAATAEAFRSSASRADIIHFAGHAVLNSVDPSLSFLLFGNMSSAGSHNLYVHDIASMKLRARVVVLSACGTAVRSERVTQGVSSIARAFYRAGVPAVIATLGDVGDRSPAAFMSLLHRDLEKGIEPASALRLAQVAMIHSSTTNDRDPRSWAAYEIVGV